MKVVAIGGVAASMSAVSKLKRLNNNIEIVVYEKGDVLSYGACGMPYFISDEIKHKEQLIARTKEQFLEKGILVEVFHEVLNVYDKENMIEVKNLKTNEVFKTSYDVLIVGSGASAMKLPIPGNTLKNIHPVKVFEDGVLVKHILENENIKDVVVVGGGFIGIEMVEALHTRGINVTLIEYSNHILTVFDDEVAIKLEKHLEENGVKVCLSERVMEFRGQDKVDTVVTDKGTYHADLVIMSVGIKPNTSFLESSNVLLQRGAVITDKFMRTNIPNIYSGGDCSLIYNKSVNDFMYLPMGSNANKQGKIIAENINGGHFEFEGVLGTIVIKVLDMEAAKTGISEKEAVKRKIKHKIVTATGNNHAGYYPNPEKITVKIIYDPFTYVILGAELVGRKDTALRINMFVIAIHMGMTTKQLGFSDLAYAPPFAGVWDVVAQAANLAK